MGVWITPELITITSMAPFGAYCFQAAHDIFDSLLTNSLQSSLSKLVDNAALFKVDYKLNYKVVTNTANGGNKEYVLYQCGTPVPDRTLFRNTTVFVEIPVKNAATIATTPLAFIELLGRRSALRAVDTESLITSPCVQYDLEQKKIVPLEDKNLTLRAEQFLAADVVFSTFGAEPGTANKTVVTSEVSDPGPLNVSPLSSLFQEQFVFRSNISILIPRLLYFPL